MKCSNCENEIPENTILCPYCSYNVQAAQQKVSVINTEEFQKTVKNGFTFIKFVKALPFLLFGLFMLIVILIYGFKFVFYEKIDATLVEYKITDTKFCGVYEYTVNGKTYKMDAKICEKDVSELKEIYPISYDKNNPSEFVEGSVNPISFIFTGIFMIFMILLLIFAGKLLKYGFIYMRLKNR